AKPTRSDSPCASTQSRPPDHPYDFGTAPETSITLAARLTHHFRTSGTGLTTPRLRASPAVVRPPVGHVLRTSYWRGGRSSPTRDPHCTAHPHGQGTTLRYRWTRTWQRSLVHHRCVGDLFEGIAGAPSGVSVILDGSPMHPRWLLGHRPARLTLLTSSMSLRGPAVPRA